MHNYLHGWIRIRQKERGSGSDRRNADPDQTEGMRIRIRQKECGSGSDRRNADPNLDPGAEHKLAICRRSELGESDKRLPSSYYQTVMSHNLPWTETWFNTYRS
jgi:hypothetical protein